MNELVLQAWLSLLCESLGGVRTASVWRASGQAAAGRTAIAARWPAEAAEAAALGDVADEALREGRVVVRTRTGSLPAPQSQVAVPVAAGAVAVVEVAHARRRNPENACKQLVDRIQSAGAWLEPLQGDSGGRERLARVLGVVASGLEPGSARDAAAAVATELALALDCDRVSLARWEDERARVEALSHGAHFDSRSQLVADLAAAMEEAVDQDTALRYPAPSDAPLRVLDAHRVLARHREGARILTLPLGSRGEPVGALCLERTDPRGWDAASVASCQEAGLLLGPLFELHRRASESGAARLWRVARERAREFVEPGRSGRRVLASVAMGLALVVCIHTSTWRVHADATLEGRVQRAVVAGFEGYLAEARVRAGDTVRAGDLLARLDDGDLAIEQRQWAGKRDQLRREAREALASHDRAQVSVLQARIDQAEAQLALAEEKLARATLRAPFDGIVVKGDLSRALGTPVSRGDVLFEVAPLDGYRIFLSVDEREIADVVAGQRGALTLSALPGESLPLTVERVVPIAVQESGRNSFRVEARLDGPVAGLRPGMEGVGKIEIGPRRSIWIWTHQLSQKLRLWLWSLWP